MITIHWHPLQFQNLKTMIRSLLSRVFQIYQERLGDLSGMNINIVGSFKEKEILPFIEKYIASLPTSGKKITYTDNRVHEVKGKVNFRFYKGKEKKVRSSRSIAVNFHSILKHL